MSNRQCIKLPKKSIILLLCFGLTGCASVVGKYLKDHPDLTPEIKSCMVSRALCKGMSKEQIVITFGEPIKHTTDEADENEVLVYKEIKYYSSCYDCYTSVNAYLSFQDGILFRIESEEGRRERYRRHKIEKYMQGHPAISPDIKEVMLNKKIRIGMTKEEVIFSWGTPEDINRTVGPFGVHEQWCYDNHYLYFEDGILTSWQD